MYRASAYTNDDVKTYRETLLSSHMPAVVGAMRGELRLLVRGSIGPAGWQIATSPIPADGTACI